MTLSLQTHAYAWPCFSQAVHTNDASLSSNTVQPTGQGPSKWKAENAPACGRILKRMKTLQVMRHECAMTTITRIAQQKIGNSSTWTPVLKRPLLHAKPLQKHDTLSGKS